MKSYLAEKMAIISIFSPIMWISGGGMLALLSVWILNIFIDPESYNSNFILGCLWGTFGTLSAIIMTKWFLRPIDVKLVDKNTK